MIRWGARRSEQQVSGSLVLQTSQSVKACLFIYRVALQMSRICCTVTSTRVCTVVHCSSGVLCRRYICPELICPRPVTWRSASTSVSIYRLISMYNGSDSNKSAHTRFAKPLETRRTSQYPETYSIIHYLSPTWSAKPWSFLPQQGIPGGGLHVRPTLRSQFRWWFRGTPHPRMSTHRKKKRDIHSVRLL